MVNWTILKEKPWDCPEYVLKFTVLVSFQQRQRRFLLQNHRRFSIEHSGTFSIKQTLAYSASIHPNILSFLFQVRCIIRLRVFYVTNISAWGSTGNLEVQRFMKIKINEKKLIKIWWSPTKAWPKWRSECLGQANQLFLSSVAHSPCYYLISHPLTKSILKSLMRTEIQALSN